MENYILIPILGVLITALLQSIISRLRDKRGIRNKMAEKFREAIREELEVLHSLNARGESKTTFEMFQASYPKITTMVLEYSSILGNKERKRLIETWDNCCEACNQNSEEPPIFESHPGSGAYIRSQIDWDKEAEIRKKAIESLIELLAFAEPK